MRHFGTFNCVFPSVNLGSGTGKRRAARPESKELDRKTESPSPTRAVLQSCDTATSLISIVQPAMPFGNFGLSALELQALLVRAQLMFASCLDKPDQVTSVEGSNAGYSRDNTMKTKSAYPREEAPACFPTVKNPEYSHVPPICGGRLGAEHIDLETREYLWPNEQVLHISSPACVDPHTSVGSLVASVNSPIAYSSHLSACVATNIVGSMGDVVGRLHEGGVSRDPFHDATVTPANPEDHFGMILDTCEAGGFPSIETEYYSVSFAATSSLAATQSPRKSPNLRDLPNHPYVASSPWTHEAEDAWPFNESKRFREQILRIAENILTSEVGQLGMVRGDQSASVAPVLVEQRNGRMGSDGNSTASCRGIEATESFEKLKPVASYWLNNGST